MASFAKLCVWPVGYFRAYSSWLLKNRREVAARINVLTAEIDRIGFITVEYGKEEGDDGSVFRNEQRMGIRVTEGSSLGLLLRAYIASGGDPLNISPFMYPNTSQVSSISGVDEPVVKEKYPHGGVVAPISSSPLGSEATETTSGFEPDPGGNIRMESYYPARQGGKIDPGSYDHDAVVRTMHHIRSWANQDIKERVQDIEWRIIKLCDLREQLIKERDEVLVAAFGGAVSGVGPLDEEQFDPGLRMQYLIQDMYELLYEIDETGGAVYRAKDDVQYLQFTFPDTAAEAVRDPLGC